jgi:hypothetical protein
MRLTQAIVIILLCTPTSVAQKSKSVRKPEVSVTVEELQKDYADNVVAADRKYRLKLLEVTGKIKGIGRVPMSSDSFIAFETEGEILVQAHFFRENEDLLLKVKRGDTVTVIGYGAGLSKEMKLYISRCSALKKVDERDK